MTINTLIPAVRRGMVRSRIALGRATTGRPLCRQPQTSPLTREETRLAVIEVLG